MTNLAYFGGGSEFLWGDTVIVSGVLYSNVELALLCINFRAMCEKDGLF
jgi:hypothetical protein